MTPIQFVQALQLTDSFFPVGAFAYSDGLETATASGTVHDAHTLGKWLDHFLDNVFVPCDGLALMQCAEAMRRGDRHTIHEIDEELTAIRTSLTVRNASRSVGRRMLAAYSALSSDPAFLAFAEELPQCNAPVVYAIVMTHRGIENIDAILAFGYSRLAGMVSAGLRLISIGQHEAHRTLTETLERLPDAADRIVRMGAEPLRSFAPMMDIAQMNHRYVYSRLFRS